MDDVLNTEPARRAFAVRDIAVVYRLLMENGVTQRQIAALTGQSQSEVSEILNGRQVMGYNVLVRIADGLGVPRGWIGLAYTVDYRGYTYRSPLTRGAAEPSPVRHGLWTASPRCGRRRSSAEI